MSGHSNYFFPENIQLFHENKNEVSKFFSIGQEISRFFSQSGTCKILLP